jgi:TolB-like protein
MATREQRGNREAKKPKKEKPKDSVAASPFANTQSKPEGSRPGGSKK